MFSYDLVVLVAIVFFFLYLPRIYAWFVSFKPQKKLVNSKKNKIALFIPARNEGKAILPLLESLKKQTYDKSRFDIFIVVKESDDPVIEYGKSYGAEVFVDPTQKCKGDCLDFGFNKIIHKYPGKYDGFLIVDADCVLYPDFVEQMNNAMASGAEVINGKKIVGNYFLNKGKNSNFITASNGLIWTLMDDMGNRWKSDHGFTTMTVTTGILISSHLIEKWDGWIYKKTLTEDMELQRDCSLQEYKTFYYSYAKFYMQEATSIEETDKRRTRWMTGLTHADFIYAPQMLKKISIHSIADNYYMYCLWIVYLFIAANIVISLADVGMFAFAFFANGVLLWSVLGAAGLALLNTYLAFFVMTFVALIVARHDIKLSFFEKVIVLFYHPIFYMKYIPIVANAIVDRRPQVWDEIERVDNCEQIVK